MPEYRLRQNIIAISVAKTWEAAKSEWSLHGIYFCPKDQPQTCLCGHFPIREICKIVNRDNKFSVEVGNCCVKKFIGLPSDKIFRGIKRIQKDGSKSLNADAIEHAHKSNWINDYEYRFSLNTAYKRNLSIKQLAIREQINHKVLARFAAPPLIDRRSTAPAPPLISPVPKCVSYPTLPAPQVCP
jgi:hypothetical protein